MNKILLSIVAVFLMAWVGVAFAGYEINVVTGKLDKTAAPASVVDFDPSNYGGVNWGDADALLPFEWGFNSGNTKPRISFGDGTITYNDASVTINGTSSQFCWANGICLNGDTARKLKLQSEGGTNNEDLHIDNDLVANTITFSSTTGANMWDLGPFGVKTAATTNAFGNVSIGTYGTPASTVSAAGNVSIGTAYAVAHAAPANGMVVQGNVGVGTWLPTTPLEVVGTIKATAFESQSTSPGVTTFYEAAANGNNTISVTAPTAITSNVNCQLQDDSTPFDLCVSGGGGGGSPGGSSNAVQYNSSGSFAGDSAAFAFNGSNVGIGTSDLSAGRLLVHGGPVGIGTWKPSGSNALTIGSGSSPAIFGTTGNLSWSGNANTIGMNSAAVQMTGNGFIAASGQTTGTIYSCTGNSLTSGACFSGASSNNGFTGNVLSASYSGTGSGRAAVFSISNASATGNVLHLSQAGTGAALTAIGNVGLGTTVPQASLDIKQSNAKIRLNNSGTGANVFATFGDSTANDVLEFGLEAAGDFRLSNTGNHDMWFGTNDTERVRIKAAGTVVFAPTDTPDTCNAGLKGGIYYDNSLGEACDCDGTSWAQIDGGGAC